MKRSTRIKFIKQTDSNDCGLACVSMLSNYFGCPVPIRALKKEADLNSDGVSIENLMAAGSKIGMSLIPLKITDKQLLEDIPTPAIAYWNQNHFILLEKITENYVTIIDPAVGRLKLKMDEFLESWLIDNRLGATDQTDLKGVLLLVKPEENFGSYEVKKEASTSSDWNFIKRFFLGERSDNFRVFLSLIIVSLLQLTLPFLNQLIIDQGVMNKNIAFVYAIGVIAALFYVLISINEFIRSWSLVYLSTRINYQLISEFLEKITKLPISTIYSKKTGDYVERINDHKRLETYFSESLIHGIFSFVTLILYAALLLYFSSSIFLVVIGLSALELVWIFRFINSIKTLDNKLFGVNAQDQEKVYEILSNLPDIKLNTIEHAKNKEWQSIQKRLFKINIAKLKLSQIEKGGSKIIASIQLILVTVISAQLAANGDITIGAMLSILFIVNQLNNPISQLINFFLDYQVIRNSIDRIREIHDLEEEPQNGDVDSELPTSDIAIEHLTFGYHTSANVLKDVSLTIPRNKTTAIVGFSGSGKTTLLKLLLKFYQNYDGTIVFAETGVNFSEVGTENWRKNCGAVLQESSIYSESIAYNVALDINQNIDEKRLRDALEVACLDQFVDSLPLGVFTRLTSNGNSLSSGQKQRLMIARLVYQNPKFIFLDEATNALDANTEKAVITNLNNYFEGKTIVVVAHRLSTVKNADQIVVLDQGEIKEIGTHSELIELGEYYYNLVKNQLELEGKTL